MADAATTDQTSYTPPTPASPEVDTSNIPAFNRISGGVAPGAPYRYPSPDEMAPLYAQQDKPWSQRLYEADPMSAVSSAVGGPLATGATNFATKDIPALVHDFSSGAREAARSEAGIEDTEPSEENLINSFTTAWHANGLQDWAIGRENAMAEAAAKRISDIEAITGQKIPNPYQGDFAAEALKIINAQRASANPLNRPLFDPVQDG